MTRSPSIERIYALLVSATFLVGIAHAQSNERLNAVAAKITDSTAIETFTDSTAIETISPAELRKIVIGIGEGGTKVELRSQIVGDFGWTSVSGAQGTVLCGHITPAVSDSCYYYRYFGWIMNCRPKLIGQTELVACDRIVGKGTGFFATDLALFASPTEGQELKLLIALPAYVHSANAESLVFIQISDGVQPRATSTLRRCAEMLIEPYSSDEQRYISAPECEVYQFDSATHQFEHVSGPNSAKDGIELYYRLATAR